METDYQKNQIIAFEKAIKLFENNRRGKWFKKIPQIAFLIDSNSGKIIGVPKINNKNTHAEVLALQSIEINNFNNDQINLIVSSHPCPNCIIFLSSKVNQSKIKNVFYISKSAYLHKVEDYNEIAKDDEKLPKFEDIEINFIKYNDFNNKDIKKYTDIIDNELNEYLLHNMLGFGEYLLKNSPSGNINLEIEKYKDEIHNLDTLSNIIGKKIYTIKNGSCTIIRSKLKEACETIRHNLKEKTPI